MTFLAPAFFYGSVLVGAAITALHFIVTRQPRAGILPTARFVPDMPATATARARKPSDLGLLLLRIFLILAAGAGLAKPVIKPSRTAQARVILADASRSVSDADAIRDSVRTVYRDGDLIIAFDSATRILTTVDSLTAPSTARGNLSAALIAAVRAGSTLRERADSIELVVVSPFSEDELDAATELARSLWSGRAKVIVSGRAASSVSPTAARLSLRGSASDPLAITVARLSGSAGIIIRDGSLPPDATSPALDWPAAARPARAVARTSRDTIGGVMADDAVVISAFERRWSYTPDSIRGAEVVARWIDGEAAAIEWTKGEGCSRSVGVPVSTVGDLVIRSDFLRLVSRLTQPCIGARPFVPVDPAGMEMIQGNGGLASRDVFQPRGDVTSWLAPWLLGLALVLAVAEIIVRRRLSGGAISRGQEPSDLASAA